MITDLILILLGKVFTYSVSVIPEISIISNLIQIKEDFITFISSFMPYTLYMFNVPVLKLALGLLTSYIVFLSAEYLIKLSVKYFTNVF